MINSRRIEDLTYELQALCHQWISMCEQRGFKVLITSTFRDKESQDAIYAQGRTAPGNKVTNARGGQSMHQYRVAFDFVPLRSDGKTPDWADLSKFEKCGEVAEMLGLEWGGRWTRFKDMPHIQKTDGLTLAQFQSLYPSGEAPADDGQQGSIKAL